jgi:hypothetical protein
MLSVPAVLWPAAAPAAALLPGPAAALLLLRLASVRLVGWLVLLACNHQAQAQRDELIKQDVTQILKTFYCQVGRVQQQQQ